MSSNRPPLPVEAIKSESDHRSDSSDCSSTSSRTSSANRIPDDPKHQFGVMDAEGSNVDSARDRPASENSDSRSSEPAASGSRVRFRVESTNMADSVTPTEANPSPSLDGATKSALRAVGRSLDYAGDEAVLTSVDSLSAAESGDSMDSLYNLTQILPSSAISDRALAAASFIESIPPYVTVRLPSDVPAPALPLSWIRHGDQYVNPGHTLTGQAAQTASPNWRHLNKSASYTAASSVVSPLPIVSQAYRSQYVNTSPARILSRIHPSGRGGRQQAMHQWPSRSSLTSTTPVGQVGATAAFGCGANAISEVGPATSPIFPTLKHVQTEHVMSKHALKSKLNKYQRILDGAFAAILSATSHGERSGLGSESVLQSNTSVVQDALSVVSKVFAAAWALPTLGLDLAYGLCNYVREMGYLDTMADLYLNCEDVRECAGVSLGDCFSGSNREYLVNCRGLLEPLVLTAKMGSTPASVRVSLRIFEGLFRQNAQISATLISLSALDYVLNACKAFTDEATFRHAAFALANLAMYGDHDCHQKMLEKNVPDWLFLLASSQDDVTRYYACLAICTLVSNKEIESAVSKSGTLSLVEPFLASQKPSDIASKDTRHRQGRRPEWLAKLVPTLNAKRREPRAIAAFHFAMEAEIKQKQERADVLREIGAVDALKQAAALPDEMASKFASQALEIVGETCPHKLSPQVPLWTVEDVQYWVTQIGFEAYASAFVEQKVDGDLLLLLSNDELANDIGMTSSLHRKRFMRELDSLKMAADYSCIDETKLDRFLASVDPHFSIYTYRLLDMGVDCSVLPSLCDTVLKEDCGVLNPVHRLKLLDNLEECKHVDDMEVALLSKRIDIFISYRRSTGNQLASLLKVLLQLRSHKVFIDVDRLYAGQFDSSLLKNIQAAKHFILVLTPGALDRCVGDDVCNDWVHKEVRCALEHNKNVIPVLDPRFEWPDENLLPADMRAVTRFNAVRWVHEYQEACVAKLEKFIKGELNVNRGFFPSLPQRNRGFVPTYNRSMSKPNSSSNGSATDLVLDGLVMNNRNGSGCRSSNERLLATGIEPSINDAGSDEG